jgi:hypothetical protein
MNVDNSRRIHLHKFGQAKLLAGCALAERNNDSDQEHNSVMEIEKVGFMKALQGCREIARLSTNLSK